jgi:hypothetical protein
MWIHIYVLDNIFIVCWMHCILFICTHYYYKYLANVIPKFSDIFLSIFPTFRTSAPAKTDQKNYQTGRVKFAQF